MSETPRTDAAIQYYGVGGTAAIKPTFARELERDYAALLAQAVTLAEWVDKWGDKYQPDKVRAAASAILKIHHAA